MKLSFDTVDHGYKNILSHKTSVVLIYQEWCGGAGMTWWTQE